ncbi:MAG TPA: TonB family protein [Trichocoleus sp.]
MIAETYRDRLHASQKNRLTLCFITATAIHLGAIGAGFTLQHFQSAATSPKNKKPSPITVEFVYLDPKSNSAPKPGSADRHAQIDSTAAGQHNPNLPISPGKPVPPRAAQSTPPAPAPVPPAPLPRVPPPRPFSPSTLRLQTTNRSLPEQAPAPTRSSAASSPVPVQPRSPSLPPRLQNPNAQSSNAQSPNAQSLNAQLGRGLDGALNPNRTAAGNGSVDATRDDLWGTYISALNQKIDQNWQRISVTTNRQAKVRFEVDRQGQLVNLQLIQPSGDARADMTALQSIRAAAPFAPLPRGANEEMLVINFTFTYRVTALSNSAAETAGSQ